MARIDAAQDIDGVARQVEALLLRRFEQSLGA
jgi:Rod binding domain-containing protein